MRAAAVSRVAVRIGSGPPRGIRAMGFVAALIDFYSMGA
jgi:hypothetical protein